jgi:hypothetical protein
MLATWRPKLAQNRRTPEIFRHSPVFESMNSLSDHLPGTSVAILRLAPRLAQVAIAQVCASYRNLRKFAQLAQLTAIGATCRNQAQLIAIERKTAQLIAMNRKFWNTAVCDWNTEVLLKY